jgi:murein DD-endopeptidase MepM/ murein hydrolase activator NlpD
MAAKDNWRLVLTLDQFGKLTSYLMEDLPTKLSLPELNSTPIRLPFKGRWYVSSGGPTREQNHHIDSDQYTRHGIDFCLIDEQGYPNRGHGIATTNESYYAYGQELIAAAPGEVVTVIDGIPDNPPNSLNTSCATGNAIVIQHSSNEFSVYMHMQRHKFTVKEGQHVRQGLKCAPRIRPLGLLNICGNRYL